MILFLLLLIVAGVAVAMYAAQNTASHDVTLLQWHWSAVPDWCPWSWRAPCLASGSAPSFRAESRPDTKPRRGFSRDRVSSETLFLCDSQAARLTGGQSCQLD